MVIQCHLKYPQWRCFVENRFRKVNPIGFWIVPSRCKQRENPDCINVIKVDLDCIISTRKFTRLRDLYNGGKCDRFYNGINQQVFLISFILLLYLYTFTYYLGYAYFDLTLNLHISSASQRNFNKTIIVKA